MFIENETVQPLPSSIVETIKSKVLVIIPAYNEEKCIGKVIRDIRKSTPFEDILVINDGSLDNTAAIALQNGAQVLNLPFNLGIGGAVRAGYAFAEEMGYSWVVRLDGDGQHNPDDILRLFAPILNGQADAVFGSRFCGDINSYRPSLGRRTGIWLYGFLVSLIIGQRIYDATSGLWCVNRKTMRFFKQNFPQDYPEVESHILLYKAGLIQKEVPAQMHARFAGRSSISLFPSVYYAFKVLLAIFVRAVQALPRLQEEETFADKSTDYSYSG